MFRDFFPACIMYYQRFSKQSYLLHLTFNILKNVQNNKQEHNSIQMKYLSRGRVVQNKI